MIRVLLDEDVPIRLRHHLGAGIQCETVQFRGWKGLKNGELLRVAQHDFDVLVTLDGKIPSQQNLAQFDIGILILRPASTRIEDLVALVPEIERRAPHVRPGGFVLVEGHPPGSSGSGDDR